MSDNEMSTRLKRLRAIIDQLAQRALNAGESHSLVSIRRAEAEEIVAEVAAQSATVSYLLSALTAMQEERERLQTDSRRLDWLISNGARSRASIDQILAKSAAHAAFLGGLPGLPVADMIDRGWLSDISDISDEHLEDALCRFFEVGSSSELRELLYGPAADAAIGEPAAEQDTGTADDQIDPAVVEKMREYTDRTISTMDVLNQALKAAKEGRS